MVVVFTINSNEEHWLLSDVITSAYRCSDDELHVGVEIWKHIDDHNIALLQLSIREADKLYLSHQYFL